MPSKLDDPTWRKARAKKAATARTSIDYHVAKVVEAWPTLSDETVAKLRQLFIPAGGDAR